MTDPVSMRNLEPGDGCNDDCLHAKFELIQRFSKRLDEYLRPVADRGFLRIQDTRDKLTASQQRLYDVEDAIEGRGGADTGLIGRVNEIKPAGVTIGKLLDTTMSKLFITLTDLQKNGAKEVRMSKSKYNESIESLHNSVNAMLKGLGNQMLVNSYSLNDDMDTRVKAATGVVAAGQRSSMREVGGVDRKIAKANAMAGRGTADLVGGLDDAGDDVKKLLAKGGARLKAFNLEMLESLGQLTARHRALLDQKIKVAKREADIRVEQVARQMRGMLSQSSKFFVSLTRAAQTNFTGELAAVGIGLQGLGKLTDKALSDLYDKMDRGVGHLSREDARAVLAQNQITYELEKDIALQQELTKRMSAADTDALAKIRQALGQDSGSAEKVLVMLAQTLEGETHAEANTIEADLASVILKSKDGARALEDAMVGDTAKLQHFIRELEVNLSPQVYGAGKVLKDSEDTVMGELRDRVYREKSSIKGMSSGVTGRMNSIGEETVKTKKELVERGKDTLRNIMDQLSTEKSSVLNELLVGLKQDDRAHSELLALIGGSSESSLKGLRQLAAAIRGVDSAMSSETTGMDNLKKTLMSLAGRGDVELGALSTLLTQATARTEADLKSQWARSTVMFDGSRRDVNAFTDRIIKELHGNTTAKIPDMLKAFIEGVRGIQAGVADTRALMGASDNDLRRLGAEIRGNRAGMEISESKLKQTMGSLLQHVDASNSKYLVDLADQSTKWSRYLTAQMRHYLDTQTRALVDRTDMEGASAEKIYTTLSEIQHKLSTGDAVLDASLLAGQSKLSKESEAHKKNILSLGEKFLSTFGGDSEEVKKLHGLLTHVVRERGQDVKETQERLQQGLRNITAAVVRDAMDVKHHYLYMQEVLERIVKRFRDAMHIDEDAERERQIKQHTFLILQLVKLVQAQQRQERNTKDKSDEAIYKNERQITGLVDILEHLLEATGSVQDSEVVGGRTVEHDLGNLTGKTDDYVNSLRSGIGKDIEASRQLREKEQDQVGRNLRGTVSTVARKSGSLDHEVYDTAVLAERQARNDESGLKENERDLRSAAGTVAMFGYITGNELKALTHQAHASNEAMHEQIARAHGVNLDRMGRVEDVIGSFVSLTEGFINETKDTLNEIRNEMTDAARLSSEQLSHASFRETDVAKSATTRANAILQAIETHRATSKTISGELRRRLYELETLSVKMDQDQIAHQNGVEAMLADAREKVRRSEGSIKRNVHDWIKDASSRYTQMLLDARR